MIIKSRRLSCEEAQFFSEGYMLIKHTIDGLLATQKTGYLFIDKKKYSRCDQKLWLAVKKGLCVKNGFELYKNLSDALIEQRRLARIDEIRKIHKASLGESSYVFEGLHEYSYSVMLSTECVKLEIEEPIHYLYIKKKKKEK